jgi:hypothetical protein
MELAVVVLKAIIRAKNGSNEYSLLGEEDDKDEGRH